MSEEQLEPQENPQPEPTPQPSSQNPFPPQNGGFGYGMQQSLPNATVVLVLGILSIVFCCCYGILGLIPAIIALVLSKKDRGLYQINPGAYTLSSYKNLNAGRVCAIIGLILNILSLLYFVAIIIMFGAGILSNPKELQEIMKGMQ
ncbi:CCC motif membrane protein [Pedobacter sp. UC225_61]|uniref:CCC motif membrane protein n=1 Tax=Pedobacter sp. UC225_61 TaxID=3374623 RepID=UPI00378BA8D6